MYIETRRLVVRNFQEQDISKAYEYLNKKKVMRYIEEPFDETRTKEFINSCGIIELPRIYALIEKQTDNLIGHIIFQPYQHKKIYEIGWIIDNKYQKKGYAYEISKAIFDFGFSKLNLHKIIGETIEDNQASIALMKKLGMKREAVFRKQNFHDGRWRDEIFCGILAEEYYQQKSICPLCKKPNHCAMAKGEEPSTCFCMTIDVPKELLDQIPKEDRGSSCICKDCIEQFNQSL